MMDQSRPGSPRLPFFGHPAKTNLGLATLWQRYPAPIIPGFIHRSELGKHIVELQSPLDIETTEDRKADILAHSEQFNRAMETMIADKPEQYFWLHRRWK